MKMIFLILMIFPTLGFSQKLKIRTNVQQDTIKICHRNYLFRIINKSIFDSERSLEIADLVILETGNNRNDTVLAFKTKSDPALKIAFQGLDAKDYSLKFSYQLISENILEVVKTESQYFEGAAHGESRFESSFFNIKARSNFDLNDIFLDTAFPVINQFVCKELNLDCFESNVEEPFIKINRYGFDNKNLILIFHYLDADSPVAVLYAEQVKEVYIPFRELRPFLKQESPVYRMINGTSCQ